MVKDSTLERFDAKSTYDSGATDYVQASERFWAHLSDRTVEAMRLEASARVLDVPCGPGWSALRAAERVGSSGRVLALDSSAQMLELVRDRAAQRGLDNLEFLSGDMTQLELDPASLDAVVSVLGLFFVEDMPALVRKLWGLVRPGGQLAITVLGAQVFDPPFSLWKEAVRSEAPEVLTSFPWERTDRRSVLQDIFEAAGVDEVELTEETGRVALPKPEDFWLAVMGSGMRRTVIELGDRAEAVRNRVERALNDAGIDHMDVPGIYARADKR